MKLKSGFKHILGIETSCDDTGVAIVRNDGAILSNCLNSQLRNHLQHGGIIPVVAGEYHMAHIDQVATQSFGQSGLDSVQRDIDAIAVTNRPGLYHSLEVGLNYAKKLAIKYGKPLIPIHHMQAHALMPLLENRTIRFPFMTLLVSGGHCLIAICKKFDEFHLLGRSIDDAPGDLLDKVARRCRLRNLGHPYDQISGGSAIEMLSERKGADRFKYFNTVTSIPLFTDHSCNFSFSGYRGTFDKLVASIDELWQVGDQDALLDELSHISSSLQRSILIQIMKKLQRAVAFYRMYWRYQNEDAFIHTSPNLLGFETRSEAESDYLDLVISGGVAANKYLVHNIERVCKKEFDEDMRVYYPSKSLCSDNGLMIAWNGLLRYTDFLGNRHKYVDLPNQPVILQADQISSVRTFDASSIGLDLREQVRDANFRLNRLSDAEIRLNG